MSRLRRERTIEGHEIRLAKNCIQIDEGDAEFARKSRMDVGIVCNETHVERLGEAKNFRSDVADADRTEHPADPTDPVMVEAPIEAPDSLPRQLVLDEKPAAERKEKGDGRNRDRTPYAVRRGHKGDPSLGAGGHIDVVVAD